MKWSREEDAVLRRMYASSSSKQIADALKRNDGMVRNRCWKLGLANKVNQWTPEEIALLKAAYSVGYSNEMNIGDLAQKLGRNTGNVSRKARSLGLTDPKRPKVPPQKLKRKPSMFRTAEERIAHTSARMRDWHKNNEHPRGALGMRHTDQTKKVLSERSLAAWADPKSRLNSEELRQVKSDRLISRIKAGDMRGGYTRSSGGKRSDLGDTYFRSSWEANYARYLNFLAGRGEIMSWEYEPKTFVFEQIKRGTRAYTPDFLVRFHNGSHEWHEVKGWMDKKSKTRLDRMAKYYPDERVVVVGEEWFKSASKTLGKILYGWESKGRRKPSGSCGTTRNRSASAASSG